MLDWHLGMVEGPRGERRERLTAADALTLTRFWLVPPAVSPATRRSFASLVLAAAMSDLADGRLAARQGATRLGGDLDGTADIAFFAAATLGATRRRWVRPLAPALLALRCFASLGFVAGHYFLRGVRPPRASVRWASPLLVAGLLAAAARRPRSAEALMAAGSTLPLLWQFRFLRAG